MHTPIYLDYNASTPIDPEVVVEMLPYIQTHFGNPSSSYGMGKHNKQAIEKEEEIDLTIQIISEAIQKLITH
ncbi:MAG: aminotransferase class V-fold PLP-dependent enzyme [Draconibacterium sp.]